MFKNGEGRVFHKNVLADKEQLQSVHYEIKILIQELNQIKDEIDKYKTKIDEKKKENTEIIEMQRVIDEEEYNFVLILNNNKKEYKLKSELLQLKKNERSQKEEYYSIQY